MPTLISGRPILALGLSAAIMWWQASGISKPMPRAVPGSTATNGFPPFFDFKSIPASSIFRKILWICITISKQPCAGLSGFFSFVLAITPKSIPAAKSFLAEVIITPVTLWSEIQFSTSSLRSTKPCSLITFIGRLAQSQVIVAMPSPSCVFMKSDILVPSN